MPGRPPRVTDALFVPNSLLRLVSNESELALLTRVGELGRVVDVTVAYLWHAYDACKELEVRLRGRERGNGGGGRSAAPLSLSVLSVFTLLPSPTARAAARPPPPTPPSQPPPPPPAPTWTPRWPGFTLT